MKKNRIYTATAICALVALALGVLAVLALSTGDDVKDLNSPLWITLWRYSVYGPEYTLTIEPDGRVTFQGTGNGTYGCLDLPAAFRHRKITYQPGDGDNAMVKCTATATLDKAAMIELATEVRKADFFNLSEIDYVPEIPAEEHWVSVQMGWKYKKLWWGRGDGLETLDRLMTRIDVIATSAQWTTCDSAPCTQPTAHPQARPITSPGSSAVSSQ